MTWYCAHVLILNRTISDTECAGRKALIEEQCYLVSAKNADRAFLSAEKLARESLVDNTSVLFDGVNTCAEFLSVRKIISVANPFEIDLDNDRPIHGTELTYSRFEVEQSDLDSFVKGRPVWIRCLE